MFCNKELWNWEKSQRYDVKTTISCLSLDISLYSCKVLATEAMHGKLARI